jgi:hypothetical protein
MKILWICGSQIVGGAERVTIQVLSLLRDRSHSIGALVPAGSPVCGAVEGLVSTLYTGRLGGRTDSSSVTAIARAVRSFLPQIVFVTTPSEWLWSCGISRRRLNAPLVLARHMTLRLPARTRRLANLRADAVVAVSESVRQNLLGQMGIREDLIRVIRNPVRFKIRNKIPLRRERARLRKSMGLPETGRWIGFFGGNDPRRVSAI